MDLSGTGLQRRGEDGGGLSFGTRNENVVDGGSVLLMVKENEGAVCVEMSRHIAQSKTD